MSPLEIRGPQKNTSTLEPDTTATDTSVGANGICPKVGGGAKLVREGTRDKSGEEGREHVIAGLENATDACSAHRTRVSKSTSIVL